MSRYPVVGADNDIDSGTMGPTGMDQVYDSQNRACFKLEGVIQGPELEELYRMARDVPAGVGVDIDLGGANGVIQQAGMYAAIIRRLIKIIPEADVRITQLSRNAATVIDMCRFKDRFIEIMDPEALAQYNRHILHEYLWGRSRTYLDRIKANEPFQKQGQFSFMED